MAIEPAFECIYVNLLDYKIECKEIKPFWEGKF